MIRSTLSAGLALCCIGLATAASAEALRVEAVMAPKQQMRLDFEDGSRHFVLLVRREGAAKGSGPLAGADVVEYGMHDLVPGVGGEPRGYLKFTAPSGDIAYVKWLVKAAVIKGPTGKPKLIDHGVWELAGGTGKFKGMRGLGTMEIKPASKTDRLFILEGEIAPKP